MLFGCLALMSVCTQLSAQELKLIRHFSLEEEPSLVSADTQGNLFIATFDDEIKKYSDTGKLLNTYSPQSTNHFTALQARSTMQIMAFDENNQQLLFLDRFLNTTSSIQLPEQELGFVSVLTWAAGNSIWVADANARQLRHWRFDTRQLQFSLNLNQLIEAKASLDIQDLQQYQHRLYLFSPRQVFVFDQLGNYEREFAIPPLQAKAFMDAKLLGLMDHKLVVIDLYSGAEQEILLPEKKNYQQLLYHNDELYLFDSQDVDVYRPIP